MRQETRQELLNCVLNCESSCSAYAALDLALHRHKGQNDDDKIQFGDVELLLMAADRVSYQDVRVHTDTFKSLLAEIAGTGENSNGVSARGAHLMSKLLAKISAASLGRDVLSHAEWLRRFNTLEYAEKVFVNIVVEKPGCKIPDAVCTYNDAVIDPVWRRPEALGLIAAVGSYKWRPLLQPITFQEDGL